MAEICNRLVRQHEELVDLLAEIVAESDRFEIEELLDRLGDALDEHMEIEEELLYSPLEEAEPDSPLIVEGHEEHEQIRHAMEELYEGSVGGGSWSARARAFQNLVANHIRMEETSLIPLASRLIDTGKE